MKHTFPTTIEARGAYLYRADSGGAMAEVFATAQFSEDAAELAERWNAWRRFNERERCAPALHEGKPSGSRCMECGCLVVNYSGMRREALRCRYCSALACCSGNGVGAMCMDCAHEESQVYLGDGRTVRVPPNVTPEQRAYLFGDAPALTHWVDE